MNSTKPEVFKRFCVNMYPKNLCFDGVGHRTPYLNKPLSLIIQINRCLQGVENEKRPSFDDLSLMVAANVQNPNTFEEDLRIAGTLFDDDTMSQ